MPLQHFRYRSSLPDSAAEVMAWHGRPGAFERLTPPWEAVRLVERTGGIDNGDRVVLEVRAAGRWRRWVAEHRDFEPGRQFCDVQVEGPFRHWRHCHRALPQPAGGCLLEDEIDYALPFGALGRLLGSGLVRTKLERLFRYRHTVTAHDLALHRRYCRGGAMRIAVTGSSGLVGTALVPFLTSGGHEVQRIVRGRPDAGDIAWDPQAGALDAARLEGLDAVVHLAGENIAAHRWTTAQKERIRASRVQGTRLLCDALARLRRPPRVLLSASAIGYYGDRGDEELNEASASGDGFLPEVCRAWEAATEPAVAAGIRVVQLRFGILLSPRGGALAQMLPPFHLGVGGPLGSGRQWLSWLALDDAVGIIYHALATDDLHGPVNAVAPWPASNRDFTLALGRVLHRPTLVPVPGVVARLAFGELAEALLLASTRVVPRALLATGYRFLYPALDDALAHLLGGHTEGSTDDALARTLRANGQPLGSGH